MMQVQAPPGQSTETQAGPPAQLADQRRRGRIGPVTVGQIVVVEIGVVAVGAVLGRPVWLVAGRRHGGGPGRGGGLRALAGSLVVRGSGAAPPATAPRAAGPRASAGIGAVWDREQSGSDDRLLTALAPELSITEVVDRGSRFGVGQDDRGWFLACAVAPEADEPVDHAEAGFAGLDLLTASTIDRAVRVLAEFNGPFSVAQVVARTLVRRPVPGQPAVGQRDVWVAVRLSVPDARVEAVNRGGGIPGVHRTMAALAGRLGKALTGAGLAYLVLDRDELRDAVASAAGLDLVAEPQVETWTGLTGGGWTQRCLELRGRSEVSLGALVDAVTATSVVSHTLSVVVGRDGRVAAPLLRVAAVDGELAGLVEVVREVARRHSTAPRQLDGRHGPGIYASAPVAAESVLAGGATGGVPVVRV